MCTGVGAFDQKIVVSELIIMRAVPEQYEKATGAEIERCTTQAIREAKRRRISGRDVTPFLLKRIVELSKGKSLSTNIALVKNNAEVGADIAIALKDMRRSAT